jgi:hypothetical protein
VELRGSSGVPHRSSRSTTDELAAWNGRCGYNLLDEAPGALWAPRLFEAAGPFIFWPAAAGGSERYEENVMSKGQQRSNREIKKPKKKKEPVAAPSVFSKGLSASAVAPKKKGWGTKG